jgi:dolichol-phosphate mannosyltransferase
LKFLIIIPTYNEIQNLRGLTDLIFSVADSNAHSSGVKEVGVLVVDDNSPDGTGALAEELSQKNPRIHVLHRQQKNGLGKAYLAGFAWGLSHGWDVLCEMDADYSHNPNYLPDFWRLLQDYDVVIGSRYVKGGGVKNWGIIRKCISRGASSPSPSSSSS